MNAAIGSGHCNEDGTDDCNAGGGDRGNGESNSGDGHRSDDDDSRRAVWRALSDLYLDAPYRSHVRIAARVLAASPYSLAALRAILFDEVHPVVARNLGVTAGVWDGFDQTWLAARIHRNRSRPAWLRPRGRCARRYAILMWRLLAPRIAALRACAPAPGLPGHSAPRV